MNNQNNQYPLGGYNQQYQFNQQFIPSTNQGKLDNWAFVLSLLSFICCGIASVISIILSIVVLTDNSGRYPNKSRAKAALIISIISLTLTVIVSAITNNSRNTNNIISNIENWYNSAISESSEKHSDEEYNDETLTNESFNNEVDYSNIEYKAYIYSELIDELDENALRAETNHQDEYVAITGYLTNTDSDGNYIDIGAPKDSYEYLDYIQCYLKNDAQRQQVININIGDKITVYV